MTGWWSRITAQKAAQTEIGITTQRATGTSSPARMRAPVTSWMIIATSSIQPSSRAVISWMASGVWPTGSG